MTRKTITFDNFAGGESGELASPKAPPGSFTGQNVLRYIDGSIGPRPGLKSMAPTGLPTGAVWGFGVNDSQSKVWFGIGTAVYQFDNIAIGSATATLTGALAGTPTKTVRTLAEAGLWTYITVYGDKTYEIDHDAETCNGLVAAPGGRISIVLGDRLLVASDNTYSNRLFFSEAGNFSVWPADNFIDVGYGFELYLLAVQRTQLVLAKHDGSWWRLAGTPGVDEVLRQVARAISPSNEGNDGSVRYGVAADGRVWFVAPHGDYPAVFTGASFQLLEHLRLNPDSVTDRGDELPPTPSVGVTGLTAPSDVVLVSGSNGTAGSTYWDDAALLFTRNTWTKHTFDVALSGFVDGRLNIDRHLFFCNGGDSGVAPKFYVWPYDLGRPPISGGTFESLGDDSSTPPTCEFTLPEWWAKDGELVQVRSVTVEFKKWDHGFASDNNITVTVTPLRIDADLTSRTGGGDGTAVTATWSEDPSVASASGTRDRQSFKNWSAIPGLGNGFTIKLGALVGVAIQRVHVVLDVTVERV